MARNEIGLRSPPELEKLVRDKDPVDKFHLLDQESQAAILSFLLKDYGRLRRKMPRADQVVLCNGTLRFGNESDSEADDNEPAPAPAPAPSSPSRPVTKENATDANADVVHDKEDVVNDNNDDDDDDDDDDIDGLDTIRGSCRRPVVPGVDGLVNLMHDPYCLRKYFRSMWRLVDKHPRARHGYVYWESNNLYYEPGKAGLQNDDDFREALMSGRPVELFRACKAISSQLMLYRIVANFGPLPRVPLDPYKQCWEAMLTSRADHASTLVVRDHKGAVEVSFCGGEKQSKGALQLLEWLVGDNIPHSYDYTLAGSYA